MVRKLLIERKGAKYCLLGSGWVLLMRLSEKILTFLQGYTIIISFSNLHAYYQEADV